MIDSSIQVSSTHRCGESLLRITRTEAGREVGTQGVRPALLYTDGNVHLAYTNELP